MATIFAVSAPFLVLLALGGTDVAMALNAKNNLQDSTDAAALDVPEAVVANPNLTVAQLKTIAQTMLTTDFRGSAPTINAFHVCAPVQNDCTNGSTTMASNTVVLTTSSQAPCNLCIGGGTTKQVNASTTTVIGFGATLQLNIVMDSSASMIVGATPTDVTTISNWVSANWNSVKPGDPGPSYGNGGGDNPPCAFACHDMGGSTTAADIAQGLTNAKAAGATTRFQVMISAANQLIASIQTQSTSSTMLGKNTYMFNIYSFDTSLHQYGGSGATLNNLGFADATTAVSKVSPGLDTWLSNDMTTLISKIGTNGTGNSAASPLKFVILVTDGLQSDRNNNWSCTSNINDSAWHYSPTCIGGYATGISQTQCSSLKNAGIVLAVLETPYVPLTGQSPNVQPYEKTVRHTIFPGGPAGSSVISSALQSCASTGYYFQATSSSQIATGFLTLTNEFLAQAARIAK